MHDFFYHGIWRMDWGLGNPNKTAALIATLMVGVWLFAYIRSWAFWISLVMFTGLGVSLIHTFSRGGIIALFTGIVPLLLFARRPWAWGRIVGIILSMWVMIASSIYLDATDRFEQGVTKEDRSISNRLEVWKSAPAMMVDAPQGWGIGNSGQAYMEWYQPTNRSEQYRTLVNSHLTWLVEFGWPLRILYLLGWASIFLLCMPSKQLSFFSISFGIWSAFFIAAIFSSVAESPWLSILPGISLAGVLIVRIKYKKWPQPQMWLVPLGCSAIGAVLILLLGGKGTGIHPIAGGIARGKEPNTWIVIDQKVMGADYGHLLRRYWLSHKSDLNGIGVVAEISDVPHLSAQTLVMGATPLDNITLKSALSKVKTIILLNPSYSPQQIGLKEDHGGDLLVIFGEFSQSPAVYAWEKTLSVQRIPGAGDFLPHWPELVFATK